jgi:antitoxin MazE
MKTRIQKWGNSLALRIPKSLVDEAGLQKGAAIELSLEDGKLVISPTTQPKPTLRQLLAGITKENLHQEMDTGQIAGNEIW